MPRKSTTEAALIRTVARCLTIAAKRGDHDLVRELLGLRRKRLAAGLQRPLVRRRQRRA